RMAGFQRRDDSLRAAEELEALQRLLVSDGGEGAATGILEPAQLRTDAGIIQTGRDRVCLDDLPVVVLQDVAPRSVKDAFLALDERGGVLVSIQPVASRLDPGDRHIRLRDER